MGRSQPATFGGTCVVGRLTCLGERVRLWIARNPDLKGGARLEGPPRRTGTVQGVYLGPGRVGVRQVGLGLQAPGELGQAPARGAACLSVAMGTVAQLRSRLQRGGNRLKMHTSWHPLYANLHCTRITTNSLILVHKGSPQPLRVTPWGTCATPTLSGPAVQGGAFQLRGASGQHWRWGGIRGTKG